MCVCVYVCVSAALYNPAWSSTLRETMFLSQTIHCTGLVCQPYTDPRHSHPEACELCEPMAFSYYYKFCYHCSVNSLLTAVHIDHSQRELSHVSFPMAGSVRSIL